MTDTQPNDFTGVLPHIPDDMTLAQFMLGCQHDIQPERQNIPCLIDNDTGRTIGMVELKRRTEQLSIGLAQTFRIGENDVGKGSRPSQSHRYAIYIVYTLRAEFHGTKDYPVAIWATHLLGGIVTCSNPQLKVDELVHQLNTVKVKLILVNSSALGTALSAARIIGLPSDRIVLIDATECNNSAAEFSSEAWTIPRLVSAGEQAAASFSDSRASTNGTVKGSSKVALLCWSSGTTGPPKAVAISHTALIANIIQMAVHNGVKRSEGSIRKRRSYNPGDVALGVLPFYRKKFAVPSSLCKHAASPSAILLHDRRGDWEVLLSRHAQKYFSLRYFSPLPSTTSSISSDEGAAPVPPPVQETLFRLFPNVQIGQAYGLTEMTTTVSMIAADQEHGRLGSSGRLLPGIMARVIKPDGSVAESGERGELVVKGPASAMGYFNDPAATKETFVNGWVRTGDEVVVTEDQEVFVLDRIKEMIKVKGFQVAPAELEGCLLTHPDVEDACVVSVLDDVGRELPTAYVVLSTSTSRCLQRNETRSVQCKQSIIDFVTQHKAPYKRLTGGVLFTEVIPVSDRAT
ncbi:hypothetical protein CVT24_001670 [Panaeolus cyanescens]|uniref:AMP-dependent synthetase/ligase domain-containing protein n=1 Tax=Panaeolus cyanescens TaxID=181874 RepID=A0A409VSR2_9AGAR|nr:hypothetical protein CVT24_001670 [Panaeolus cyanescens]